MIALLLSVVALNSPQPGLIARPSLASRAAAIAGKPVDAYCAQTDDVWRTLTADRDARAGGDVLAYVDSVGGTTIFLSPTVCAPLLAKLNGRVVKLDLFGAALEALAHEAEHINGSIDEGATECAALAALPGLARSSFGIRKAVTLRTVMQGAWSRHRAAEAASPAYAGPCG